MWKENTATMTWDVLANFKTLPLLWNAYPFHPYESIDKTKNRPPLKKELDVGQYFLEQIINIFNIKTVVAVGNKAEKTLKSLNVSHNKVRHPSHGGKRDFANKLSELIY